MIKVANQGQELREVAWHENTTLADVLDAAEIELGNGAIVSVNGKPAGDPAETSVNDGDTVVITPKVANG